MRVFTKIKDVDLKILQQLDDKELPVVCSVNKYVAELCNDESFWLTRLLNKEVYTLPEIQDFKGNFTYKEIYRHLFLNKHEEGMMESAKRNNVSYYNILFYHNLYSEKEINARQLKEIFNTAVKNTSLDIITHILLHRDERRDLINEIYFSGNEKALKWLINMGLGTYFGYIEELLRYRQDEDQVIKYIRYINLNEEELEDVGEILGSAIIHIKEPAVLQKHEKILDLFLQHVKPKNRPIFMKYVWERIGREATENIFSLWQQVMRKKTKEIS